MKTVWVLWRSDVIVGAFPSLEAAKAYVEAQAAAQWWHPDFEGAIHYFGNEWKVRPIDFLE